MKDAILAAVETIKVALGDLIVDGALTRQAQGAYVPGRLVKSTDTVYPIKGAISKRDVAEEAVERADDDLYEVYVFPFSAIPQPNDLLTLGTTHLRVVQNKPIYAGSEIALSVVQAKPSGQV
jgi:hypothetical protein